LQPLYSAGVDGCACLTPSVSQYITRHVCRSLPTSNQGQREQEDEERKQQKKREREREREQEKEERKQQEEREREREWEREQRKQQKSKQRKQQKKKKREREREGKPASDEALSGEEQMLAEAGQIDEAASATDGPHSGDTAAHSSTRGAIDLNGSRGVQASPNIKTGDDVLNHGPLLQEFEDWMLHMAGVSKSTAKGYFSQFKGFVRDSVRYNVPLGTDLCTTGDGSAQDVILANIKSSSLHKSEHGSTSAAFTKFRMFVAQKTGVGVPVRPAKQKQKQKREQKQKQKRSQNGDADARAPNLGKSGSVKRTNTQSPMTQSKSLLLGSKIAKKRRIDEEDAAQAGGGSSDQTNSDSGRGEVNRFVEFGIKCDKCHTDAQDAFSAEKSLCVDGVIFCSKCAWTMNPCPRRPGAVKRH
jgi:hypothetical protein